MAGRCVNSPGPAQEVLAPMRHDSITAGSDRPVAAERTSPTVSGTVTGSDAAGGLLFSELASRYLANRELIGLKRTTLMDYESYTRVHLVPAFGAFELEAITIELIEEFIAAKRQEGKAVKSILNYLGLLARDVRVRGQARLVHPQPGRARREAARRDATWTSAFSTCRSSRRCSRRRRRTREAQPSASCI